MNQIARMGLVALLLVSASGCKSSRCKDGAYTNPEAKFCLNVPAEFKSDAQVEKRGQRQVMKFKGPKYAFIEVRWGDEAFDQTVKGMEMIATPSDRTEVIGSGATADDGWFYHIKFKQAGTHQLEYVYKRPSGGIVSCWSNLNESDVPAIKAACESLTALTN